MKENMNNWMEILTKVIRKSKPEKTQGILELMIALEGTNKERWRISQLIEQRIKELAQLKNPPKRTIKELERLYYSI